jgi:hypothetical protein
LILNPAKTYFPGRQAGQMKQIAWSGDQCLIKPKDQVQRLIEIFEVGAWLGTRTAG